MLGQPELAGWLLLALLGTLAAAEHLACLLRHANPPFLRRSGFPFLTVAITMSPGPPAGRRFSLLPQPHTEMMYRFLAPVLSAQFMTAATGRPSDIENLLPEVPPLPLFDILATCTTLPVSRGNNTELKSYLMMRTCEHQWGLHRKEGSLLHAPHHIHRRLA